MVDRSPSFLMNPTPLVPREKPDFFRIEELDQELPNTENEAEENSVPMMEDFRARWWNVRPAGRG